MELMLSWGTFEREQIKQHGTNRGPVKFWVVRDSFSYGEIFMLKHIFMKDLLM